MIARKRQDFRDDESDEDDQTSQQITKIKSSVTPRSIVSNINDGAYPRTTCSWCRPPGCTLLTLQDDAQRREEVVRAEAGTRGQQPHGAAQISGNRKGMAEMADVKEPQTAKSRSTAAFTGSVPARVECDVVFTDLVGARTSATRRTASGAIG
jgi:hypothetical protein